MKNILFHSGEFWFNPNGFPPKPDVETFKKEFNLNAYPTSWREPWNNLVRDYEHALQLALADSVKFADQVYTKRFCFVHSPGYYPHTESSDVDDEIEAWQPEGRTFFAEGIKIESQYRSSLVKCDWSKLESESGWGEEPNDFEYRKVAVLSNSPVKSETPRRIRLDLNSPAELAIYEVMQMIEKMPADIKLTLAGERLREARELVADFIDKVQLKAEPTVEGGEYRIINGKLFRWEPEEYDTKLISPFIGGYRDLTLNELQSIAALLNRAPLREETKKEKLFHELSLYQQQEIRDGANKAYQEACTKLTFKLSEADFLLGYHHAAVERSGRRSPDKSVGPDKAV